MRRICVTAITATLLFCGAAWPQSSQWVTIGRNAFAFHEEQFHDLKVKMEAPVVADSEIFIEMIGIPNTAKINELRLQIRRVLGLGNAVALEADGYRTIAFDPDWAVSDTPSFYLTLGHEAGHHFCGHSVGRGPRDNVQIELEADQFGGASVKRYEIYHGRPFFNQVFAAAVAKYSEQGSFYPARASRLEALKRGYEQGSACGNLAPVIQRGYTPPARNTGAPTPCRPVQTGPTSWACAH